MIRQLRRSLFGRRQISRRDERAARRRGAGRFHRPLAFEPLEERQLLATHDFGDAPAPYPTLEADDGARHFADGPLFGSERDVEADGQPSAAADGDDSNGAPDDEDGVVAAIYHVGQAGASVSLIVSGAPLGAKVDAWIDFNQDGDWDDAGERIADSLSVSEGANAVTFDVPAAARAGETFGRFRISTAGGPAPTGAADDGEVEDHAIAITSPMITLAGTGVEGYSGDGGPAILAQLDGPSGVAVDPAGNIYFSELQNSVIRRIDAVTGDIETFAGTGVDGFGGDGGPARAAQFSFPAGLLMDTANNRLIVSDSSNGRLRAIDLSTTIVTTIAGDGSLSYNGEGVPALSAGIIPTGVAFAPDGAMVIADSSNLRVRRIDPVTGLITTLAGAGNLTPFFDGDGGPATDANVRPSAVAVDGAGNIYLSDNSFSSARVRRIDAETGAISLVAGGGSSTADGSPTQVELTRVEGITFDGDGDLIFGDLSRIWEINQVTGLAVRIGGTDNLGFNGDQADATTAQVNVVGHVTVTAGGDLIFADTNNDRVRTIPGISAPTVQTVAVDDTATTDAGLAVTIDVLANDSDPSFRALLTHTDTTFVASNVTVAPENFVLTSGGSDFYAYLNVDDGLGENVASLGFQSLAGAGSLRFTLDDLELLQVVREPDTLPGTSPDTATIFYGDTDGSPAVFELFRDGQLVGRGTDLTLQTVVDVAAGAQATGTGNVTLDEPGAGEDRSFYDEVFALTGGQPVLRFETDSFDAEGNGDPDTFHIDGRMIVDHLQGATLTVVELDTTGTAGAAAILPDGSVRYTPAPGFVGEDSFVYTISNREGARASATVTVDVTGQPPSAVLAGPYTTLPGRQVDLDGSGSFDPDGGLSSFRWVVGTVFDFDTDSEILTLTPGEVDQLGVGEHEVVLTVTDNDGLPDTATTTLTVVSDPPVADPGAPYVTLITSPIVLDGSGSFDPNEELGDAVATFSWVVGSSLFLPSANPTLALSPADLAGLGEGTHTVELTVADTLGQTATASTTLTIETPLTITPEVAEVATGGQIDFDASGGAGGFTFSFVANNSGATLDAATGLYTAGQTAGVSDAIRVTDADQDTADATVTVTATDTAGVLSGQTFDDLDGDGRRDAGEPGLDGVAVQLLDAFGVVIAEQVTASVDVNGDGAIDPLSEQGLYTFTGLEPGDFRIREVLQPGSLQTTPLEFDLLARVPFAVGDAPRFVTTADVDGDGHIDVLTANDFSADVSILLNNGDGAFASAFHVAVGERPTSVTAADLDGDGHLDLVTANPSSDNVSILLNNGNGAFELAVRVTVGVGPRSVTAADLDGDGDLDLATANIASDNVSILLNNGDGAFLSVDHVAAGDGPISVTAADLDGDGDLDLVTANLTSDDVSVLLNNGDGAFASADHVAVGNDPRSVTAADLDGDGDLDLATANITSNDVSILLNDGNAKFSLRDPIDVRDGPTSVTAADLDGDGDLDLATANITSNITSDDVSVLLNDGNGSFSLAGSFAVGVNPNSVTAADLDGDGRPELVVANANSDNVSVLQNLSGSHAVELGPLDAIDGLDFGNLLRRISGQKFDDLNANAARDAGEPGLDGFTIQLLDRAGNVVDEQVTASVDLNGDGEIDPFTERGLYAFTFLEEGDYEIRELPGPGFRQTFPFDLSFEQPVIVAAGDGARALAEADLDSDGDLDLAVVNHNANTVSILLNDGNATFAPAGSLATGSFPTSVAAGDLNGDGRVDLAVANIGSNSVSLFLGNGDGTFVAGVSQNVTGPGAVVAVDLNRDGLLDLAVTERNGFRVAVLLNEGGGAFATPLRTSIGAGPFALTAADLNGDGHVDLAAAEDTSATGRVFILLNDGAGNLNLDQSIFVGAGPLSVFSADLDGDGDLDLAVANRISGSVSLLKNRGNGAFAPAVSISGVSQAHAVTGADLDGDGDVDLAVRRDGSVTLLANDGTGGFSAAGEHSSGTGVFGGIVAADLDGDGRPDLATANLGSDNVTILRKRIAAYEVTLTTFADGLDFGNFVRRIGGQKFEDLNADGARAPDEPGLNGVTIQLLDGEGNLLDERVTESVDLNGDGTIDPLTEQGLYEFAFLPPGDYRVREVVGLGFRQTSPTELAFDAPADVSLASAVPDFTTADLDNDGDLDLVATDRTSQSVVVLLNEEGTFAPATSFAVGDDPRRVAAADVDADGDLDLVVTTFSNTVALLRNNGDGTFNNAGLVHTGAGTLSSIVAGDLNGDGLVDLALGEGRSSSSLTVLLNDGGGAFTNDRLATNGLPTSIAAADFNGDGLPDLAAVKSSTDDISVFFNNGDGSFTARPDVVLSDDAGRIVAADFDADGDVDLAVTQPGDNSASLLLNNGDGTFAPAVEMAAGDFPFAIAASDLDSDGDVDLVVGDRSRQALVLFNDGDANFAPAVGTPSGFERDSIALLVAADLDGDGRPELAMLSGGAEAKIAILRNLTGTHAVALGALDSTDDLDFGNVTLTQIVTPTDTQREVPQGAAFRVTVEYDTSDHNPRLTGLGVRMHFDSSVFTFDGLTEVLPTNLIRSQSLEDTADLDGDPATDRFVLLAWAQLGGQWPGPPLPQELFTAQFTVAADVPLDATPAIHFTRSSTAAGYGFETQSIQLEIVPPSLDVDDDGVADALTDGLLIQRYLSNLRGLALVEGAVSVDAGRTDPQELVQYLDSIRPTVFDVDDDGEFRPETDGELILRYLFGFRGDDLVAGAVDPGGARTEAGAIVAFLDAFNPAVPGVVSPGNSPGVLDVAGDFWLLRGGRLEIELGGTRPGQDHDQLIVGQHLHLDGTLDVRTIDGFVPQAGESFHVVQHASSSGRFESMRGLRVGPDLVLAPVFDASGLTLIATAPPQIELVAPARILLGRSVSFGVQLDFAASWTLEIDYDGDRVVDQTVPTDGADFVSLEHVFPGVGSYTVSVTVVEGGVALSETGRHEILVFSTGPAILGLNVQGQWRLSSVEDGVLTDRAFGAWAPLDWRDVQFADVDGDGLTDAIGRAPSGQWWVGRNDGDRMTSVLYGVWSEAAGWRDVRAVDLEGDGDADLLGRASNGQWWAGVNVGGAFENRALGQWSEAAGWNDVMFADFDNDGDVDVLGRTDGGEWWLARYQAGAFANERVGRWAPILWNDVSYADFSGDGLLDVVGRTNSGEWWVARNTGDGVLGENVRFGGWSGTVGWSDVAYLDFDGDGDTDVIGRAHFGQWWVASNDSGAGFENVAVGFWSPAVAWRNVQYGDFDSNGFVDALGRTDSGQWWLAESDGARFTRNLLLGAWDESLDWLDVSRGAFRAMDPSPVSSEALSMDSAVGATAPEPASDVSPPLSDGFAELALAAELDRLAQGETRSDAIDEALAVTDGWLFG